MPPHLLHQRDPPSDRPNKTIIYIVTIFPIAGTVLFIGACWGCVLLRRRERRGVEAEEVRRRAALAQERRLDANYIHRRRESTGGRNEEEEVARVLAEGEVAPTYQVAVGEAAPGYEMEARLGEVPPAYVK